jgi:hypothetical protein
MKFKNERFKKHLQRRQSKKKLTSQESHDLKYFVELQKQKMRMDAVDSSPPEQMVFQFDDADKLQEIK